MIKKRLMSPGPVEIPPSVLAVASQQIPHHRTPGFRKVLVNMDKGLKNIFKTKNPVVMFASSGTGAMESAIVNFTSPGDKVIVASAGNFGDRWNDIAKAYGLQVNHIKAEWGDIIEPALIKKALSEDSSIKAVYTTLSETSTGIENDIKSIGEAVKNTGAILVVDAISGMGATPMLTDEWGVDVVVVGSQKALMIPPGLAFMAVSAKAQELAKKSKNPKFYFSFEKSLKSWTKEEMPDTPFTSAISLILQLDEALKIIQEEGMEQSWKRHALMAKSTRAGITGMGLKLFAKRNPSHAVTSVHVPAGVDGGALVKILRDTHGISIAGGQAELKGKIFRIGHIGYVDKFDIITVISAVEITLSKLGYSLTEGSGVGAVEKVFLGEENV